MTGGGDSWSSQQLIGFLSRVSGATDQDHALETALHVAASALEAEVGVILDGNAVVTSLGFGVSVPEEVARCDDGSWDMEAASGLDDLDLAAVELPGDRLMTVVMARMDDPFQAEELSVLRGMARVLSLTLRILATVEQERVLRARAEQQSRENARLLVSVRERERLLEQLGRVQRSIATRSELDEVLAVIVEGTAELLCCDLAMLRTLDRDDASFSEVIAVWSEEDGSEPGARSRTDVGVGGDAIRADDIAELRSSTAGASAALEEEFGIDVRTAVAVPLRVNGAVVGTLAAGSLDADHPISDGEREALAALAENASIALTDAYTREDLERAYHDELTGLASRSLFLDQLEQLMADEKERDELSVLFVDLDGFKLVNDTLGHAAGDQLLADVAVRLRSCVAPQDLLGRLGGDEFAAVLRTAGHDVATSVAERIISALHPPFRVHGTDVTVGASIGISHASSGTNDAERLVQDADVAMYESKANGRGRATSYSTSMRERLVERLSFENDLRGALDREELVLHYQPIMDLSVGGCVGIEALVRWRHPSRGMLPPLEFIPLAEETGLITQLDTWVLQRACADLATWRRNDPNAAELLLHVNVSADQFLASGFRMLVRDVLADLDLPTSCLVIELTERVFVRDIELAARRARDLRAMGVRIALDDFGTGYASLEYLRRLAVDAIKIDRSFVADLLDNEAGSAFVESILLLGHSLGIDTVAEGIEIGPQLRRLTERGCSHGQGYFFAKPMSAANISELLRGDLSDDRAPERDAA